MNEPYEPYESAEPYESNEPQVSIRAFLPWYTRLLPRSAVEAALRELIAPVAAPGRAEAVLDDVWSDLLGTVEGHSFRTLIGAFHDFREERGLPVTPDGDTALRQFTAHLRDADNCRRLTAAYPVLEDRLRTVTRHMLDAYAELFAAFAEDRAALAEHGLIPGGSSGDGAEARIAEVFLTGSDPHNDNRQVCGLLLADGTRLVHKPRALVSDQFVRDLYAAAEPYLAHSLRDCAPPSLTVGEHGWQGWVTAHPMASADQPERYFYRFGALCAIMGAIGASDLHDENLLACGEHPCVIDTETLLRPDAGVDNDTLPHLLINHMKLSVASTMLVPMVNPGSPIDVLMAGVGVGGEQPSKLTKAVVKDEDTDGIAVRREQVVYRHGDNVPRYGETVLRATEHFAELLAGHRDALAFVRGDAVGKVLDSYPDLPVRCLLRSTMVYSRFIDASTHPDYLAEPAEAERLFGLLKHMPDFLSPEAAAYVKEQERASLATGNVPYFLSRGDSTELGTLKNAFPGVYRTSPLATARRGVELNAARDDRYHHFVLEECFGEIVAEDAPAGLSAHSVFGGAALDGTAPGGWWTGTARRIADVGVVFDGPDGPESGWLGGIGPDRGAATITAGNFLSFHDNGGVVAFLRRAARYEPALHDTARSAERGLDTLLGEYGETLMLTPEAVFSGTSSLLLTRPDQADAERMERAFARLDERAAAGELDTDLVNGPAGLLMVLLSRQRAGAPVPGGAQRLARLRDLATAHLGADRSVPWFDVAHGELGLRWALARAAAVLGDASAAAACADWLDAKLRETGPDPAPGTGWCNGAAGLLLATAEITTAAGRREWLTPERLRGLVDAATRLPSDRPVDLSVCHGSSGVVQSLLATGRLLDDDTLTDRAFDHQERVLRTARAHGFCTGAPGRTSLIGYLLGWAGIGDTDLLLHAARAEGAPGGGDGGGDGRPGIPVAFECDAAQAHAARTHTARTHAAQTHTAHRKD